MTDSDWAALLPELRNLDDVDVMVRAADTVHRKARPEDLPRLRILLEDEDFFVREAAAWPLSEIAGAAALPELLRAYQRGFDEGHDNDGFSTALVELAAADPEGVQIVLVSLIASGDAATKTNARWLLEFCDGRGDA